MIELTDDPYLGSLHVYWLAASGSRSMPRRADIDPTEIPGLLAHLFIADILGPRCFRFRLVGSAICERWGSNPTGKCLAELDLDGENEMIVDQYAAVACTGAPRLDMEEFVNDTGRYFHYHRLLLPLSEDGHTPNMLLGGQRAVGVDGYQHSPPKRI